MVKCCQYGKAVTKTVGQSKTAESQRLVRADVLVPMTHHFRAEVLKRLPGAFVCPR